MADSVSQPSFTTADRIDQLNAIDKDIVQLLQSAGNTVAALTPGLNGDDKDFTFEGHQAAVLKPAKAYLATLDSTRTRLRRQIMALEEAGIISAEAPLRLSMSASQNTSTSQEKEKMGEGGLGKLDVGWLNSRDDRVERGMERELWEKAHAFVQEHKASKADDKMDTR
ncbi:MAG: hypothetical protein M1814_006391 [Vezdaea aestivalis]|nr:MAG: hypothetical protein M1814_006391 [Vezdaea aestivalis]